MTRISRREFLRRAGHAGLAVGIGAQVGGLAACGDSVQDASGQYDAIIVGGGSAGAIVAAKLQMASRGRKRMLVIEAGGPTSAAIGGTHWPEWLPPERSDLTIFDVPGQYSQMAFMPLGVPYQLTETGFTFQGIGLGGNCMFNGMLFQTNPPAVFDRRWPSGWHWSDIEPYFERVRQRVPVTNTPATSSRRAGVERAGRAAVACGTPGRLQRSMHGATPRAARRIMQSRNPELVAATRNTGLPSSFRPG